MQRIVKGEVNLAMKEQQAVVASSIMQAMRSAAGTPVPTAHLDYQAQQASILQLLQQGQLNQAFQQVPDPHVPVSVQPERLQDEQSSFLRGGRPFLPFPLLSKQMCFHVIITSP